MEYYQEEISKKIKNFCKEVPVSTENQWKILNYEM